MNTINYDFYDLIYTVGEFRHSPNDKSLNDIKMELNKFFKDSKCRGIIYTKNTDKPFFGMCVMPYITGEDAVNILTDKDETNYRINQYYIEIDSKLMDIDFTAKEITAMLLHEIGHIVNDSTPAKDMQTAFNKYLSDNNEELVITKSVQYRDLLAFAIKQCVINLTSIFKKEDEEIIADQFVVQCGFGNDLESAYRKLVKNNKKVMQGVPKMIALQWTLRLYKNVKIKRIGALRTINKIKKVTGSEYEKRELNIIERRLRQINDNDFIMMESNGLNKLSDLFKNFKYKGLRHLEDDLYEIDLRAKNCDEEQEALAIIRQINSRLAIIDDYINSERDISESEKDRWYNLMNKYRLIRENISKKTVYDRKFYGLFVKTPEIKSRYDF